MKKISNTDLTPIESNFFDVLEELACKSNSNCTISISCHTDNDFVEYDIEGGTSPANDFNEMHLYVRLKRGLEGKSLATEFLIGLKEKINAFNDKTTFNEEAIEYLRANGIEDEEDVEENIENLKIEHDLMMKNYDALYDYLEKNLN